MSSFTYPWAEAAPSTAVRWYRRRYSESGSRAGIQRGRHSGKSGKGSVHCEGLFGHGAVALIQAVLPDMRARRSGAVVNVSSIGAVRTGAAPGSDAVNAVRSTLESGLEELDDWAEYSVRTDY